MSDLQDIIATNAIQSFNQGVATGERVERERIIKLLEGQFASSYWSDLSPEYLLELIKGENK